MYRPAPTVRLLDDFHPRRSAANEYPALVPLILASPVLVEALDTGMALHHALGLLGITLRHETLRTVGNLPLIAGPGEIVGLLRNAACCPASWLPKDREGAEDFLRVSEAVNGMIELDGTLDREVLMRSVNGSATAMLERVRERWRNSRPFQGQSRWTFTMGMAGVAYAAWCCQEAFGLIRRPKGGPGCGAWDPQPDPCFVRALYAGRTIEAVANLACAHAVRDFSREAAQLRGDPGAEDPSSERDFWLGWPGNEERLLRAMRDMVLRRIAHRGGERLVNWYRLGPDEYDPCADTWPGLFRSRGYEVGAPGPRALHGDMP